MSVVLVQGDARQIPLQDASVHVCVCSPPYWNLRDYQTGQWVGGEAGCTHISRTARNDVDEVTLARRAAQYGTGTQAGSKVAPIQYTGTCPRCGAVRVDAQIGLEPLHDCLAWARQEPPREGCCWVCAMRVVFKEVWRVMRPEATLWLNCGDAFSSGNGHSSQPKRYRLRADLTPEQQAYVLDELAKARRISSATQEGR